jgi:CheY-like chemotaxis protein
MDCDTETRFEPLQLNAIITELEAVLKEAFPKTIATSLVLQSELPPIIGSSRQIHQALLNLCINIRDAMSSTGTITIATEVVPGSEVWQRFPQTKRDHYVCISVSDSRCGVDVARHARIFEPVFIQEASRGAGLGLSLVYGIVTRHSGFIDRASAVGGGTAFRVYLPVFQEPVGDALDKTPSTAPAHASGGGETILFVDDEENQLQLMQRFLESEGYKVCAARDGAEAVEVFLENKDTIDLAVLDVRLPKVSGWEALQRMREVRPEIKAVFATGLLSPEMEAEVANGKLTGFILKPYKLEVVLQKIAEVLRRAPAEDQWKA